MSFFWHPRTTEGDASRNLGLGPNVAKNRHPCVDVTCVSHIAYPHRKIATSLFLTVGGFFGVCGREPDGVIRGDHKVYVV